MSWKCNRKKLKVIKKVHGRVVLYTANDELFKAQQKKQLEAKYIQQQSSERNKKCSKKIIK